MTAPASPRVPWVTLTLLVSNLIAAVGVFAYPEVVYVGGFRPDGPRLYALFSSLFLHANLLHLLGNMIFLAAVGAAAELATGSVRFAIVYFVSGILGVIGHYAMTREIASPEPYIGASGAIAGCVGYYAVRYASLRVHLAPGFTGSILLVVVAWVLLQGLGAFVHIGESGGVSFWSHLAGFATGIVMCLVLRRPDPGQRELSRQRIEKVAGLGHEATAEMARRHLREHPEDVAAMIGLVNVLELTDSVDEEVQLRLRVLDRLDPDARDEHWERLLDLGRATDAPVHRRMREADRIATANPELADRLLATVEGDRTPDALLVRVGLWRKSRPERAEALLRELCEGHALSSAAATARGRGWCG